MKPYTFLSIAFLSALSLIPPIDLILKNPVNDKWFWMICVAGFFGVLTIFLKTNTFIKIISVGGFINCFFSCAPYLSFSSYVLLVSACYLYIIASRIEDWDLVINCVKSIMILNAIILFMQAIGKDSLLNFGVGSILPNIDLRYGIIGQHMQMASFSVVITSLLIVSNIYFIFFPIIVSLVGHSSWGIVSSSFGLLIYVFNKNKRVFIFLLFICLSSSFLYMIKEHKIYSFSANSGRYCVWKRTIELSNQHPIMGWGIGTFKDVFPAMSKDFHAVPYEEAHNCWLQFSFEIGYLGMFFWVFIFLFTAIKLYQIGSYSLLAGLGMIAMDMVGHFPTRQINCIPMLILFGAYCERQIRRFS